jgi:multimeric flavodoxin WrbA
MRKIKMKAVLLNGSNNEKRPEYLASNSFVLKLKEQDWSIETYDLFREDVATCIGCFGCWLKTPGECILSDIGQQIARDAAQADLLIFSTPVTFGGYSFHLKKMVDRLIPNILPFFTKINGEIHHKLRYDKMPKILAIGSMISDETNNGPDRDLNNDLKNIETFKALVKRNAINFHAPKCGVEIININGANSGLNFDSIVEEMELV